MTRSPQFHRHTAGRKSGVHLRVRPDGSRVFEPVARSDFKQNRFVAVPIDLSNEADEVFLLFSGTGVRNHGGLGDMKAKIGSENVEVTFHVASRLTAFGKWRLSTSRA